MSDTIISFEQLNDKNQEIEWLAAQYVKNLREYERLSEKIEHLEKELKWQSSQTQIIFLTFQINMPG